MARAVAAIDFGTSKISIVAGRVDISGSYLVTGSGTAPYAGFRECEWLDWEGLKQAVMLARKEALAQGNTRIKDLYVSVPGEFLRTTFCRTQTEIKNKICPEDIAALVEDQEAFYLPKGFVSLHRTPIYYMVDGNVRTKAPLGEHCRMLEAWVSHVMADTAFIYSVDELLESLGLGVSGYVAGPVAVGYHVRLHQGENTKTAVVIDAGHYSTDIMVAEGGGIVFHANIPNGGVDLTNEIARIADVPFESAEAIKRQSLSPAAGVMTLPPEVQQEIRVSLEQKVSAMMYRLIKALDGAGFMWESVNTVYLTGSGLLSPRDARETATVVLRKQLKIVSPIANILVPQSAGTALAVLDYAVEFSHGRKGAGIQKVIRKLMGG